MEHPILKIERLPIIPFLQYSSSILRTILTMNNLPFIQFPTKIVCPSYELSYKYSIITGINVQAVSDKFHQIFYKSIIFYYLLNWSLLDHLEKRLFSYKMDRNTWEYCFHTFC